MDDGEIRAFGEQLADFAIHKRKAIGDMAAVVARGVAEGRSLCVDESERYEVARSEAKAIDEHAARLFRQLFGAEAPRPRSQQ